MKHRSTHRSYGFTLVELLVAVSIFSLTMLIIVSSLLTMVDANRKGQALSSVMNNMHFALESMTRNARTGTAYLCGATYNAPTSPTAADCTGGNVVFGYTASDGRGVFYRHVSGNPGYIDRCIDPDPVDAVYPCNTATNWIKMTAPEINITQGRFYLFGTAPFPNGVQPRVVMVIRGTATVAGDQTAFDIQTTVVQRTPDR